jgi:serine O-acetyltransferase
LKDVPSNSTVVGIPGKVVIQDGVKIQKDLNHCDLPDPINDRIKQLQSEIEELRSLLQEEHGRSRSS